MSRLRHPLRTIYGAKKARAELTTAVAIESLPIEQTRDHDAELAIASRSSSDSFALLYHRYRDPVYRYIWSRVGTQDDALDLTQIVFVKAFDSIHSFRPARAAFSSWLFSIARNAVTDFHRRHKPTDPWGEADPAGTVDVEAEALGHLDTDALRIALRGLSDQKRDLLALRFGAGLTIPEIAVITGSKPEATYKQLSRLLQELRGTVNEFTR